MNIKSLSTGIKSAAFVAAAIFAYPVSANNASCDNADTPAAEVICQSTELSELAALADVLRTLVGYDIRSEENATAEDAGLNHSVAKGLAMLTRDDIGPLINASHNLAWDITHDNLTHIILIKARQIHGQDGIVVFDPTAAPTSAPIYANLGYVFDAVRTGYSMKGNVLEVSSWARPSEGVQKFRYQDGCWRLIGEDRVWADYMIEFNDDIAALSVNYLIGLAIFDYKDKRGVRRTFDAEVMCLGQNAWDHPLTYHDAGN